jgi:two-component system sensor histidine kinase QseC
MQSMWNRRFDSLLSRLLAGSLAAFAVAAAVFVLSQWVLTRFFSDALLRDSLTEQAIDVCEGLQVQSADGSLRLQLPSPLRYGYDAYVDNFQFRVLDAAGAVVVASPRGDAIQPAAGQADTTFFRYTIDQRLMQGVAVPCRVGAEVYTVQAGRSDRFSELAGDAIAPAILETGLAMGAVSLLVFVGTAVWTTRRALAPVLTAAESARAITPRNLRERLPADDLPREVRPLVGAFNQVLDRIEAGYALQQEFLAAAAHELKTPLALLRSQIELNGEGMPQVHRTQLLADIDDMGRVVNQMLHLAEVSEAQNFRFAPTDLASVAEDAIAFLSRLAAVHEVTVTAAVSPTARDALLHADRGAVFVLMKNLLENAVMHSPPGGRVTLSLDASSLSVSDDGAGIEAANLTRVFERFWRSESSRRRGGAGLGLSICREIVLSHGWSITAANRVGAGAVFTVGFTPPDRAATLLR